MGLLHQWVVRAVVEVVLSWRLAVARAEVVEERCLLMVQGALVVLMREVVVVEVARSPFESRRYSRSENCEVEVEEEYQMEPTTLLNLWVVEVEELLLLCFVQVAEADWRVISCLRTVVELHACPQMEAELNASLMRQASHRLEESFEVEAVVRHCFDSLLCFFQVAKEAVHLQTFQHLRSVVAP